MKKILTALIAAALVVSPVAAHKNKHDRDEYNHQHSQNHRHHEDCRDKNGNLILGIIIGGIAGTVLSSKPRYERDDRDYRHSRYYCTTEQVVEYFRGQRYVYDVQRCNY